MLLFKLCYSYVFVYTSDKLKSIPMLFRLLKTLSFRNLVGLSPQFSLFELASIFVKESSVLVTLSLCSQINLYFYDFLVMSLSYPYQCFFLGEESIVSEFLLLLEKGSYVYVLASLFFGDEFIKCIFLFH